MSEFQKRRSNWNEEWRKEELQEQREALVGRVREAAKDPRSKLGRDDEIRPALYVGQLLQELKTKKVTQVAISQELAARGLKVKLERISRFGASFDEAIKQKGSEWLVKKVKNYVTLLDLLSKMLVHPPDDTIFYAFRNTQFWNHTLDNVENPVTQLSWLIDAMA